MLMNANGVPRLRPPTAVEDGDFRGLYSPTYWVAGEASARLFVLFVHFVVLFLIFNTTKCLALTSPATQSGEDVSPRILFF